MARSNDIFSAFEQLLNGFTKNLSNILNFGLTKLLLFVILMRQSGNNCIAEYGGIAQLGERLNGIQEVSGSIPLISTKKHQSKDWCFFVIYGIFLTE